MKAKLAADSETLDRWGGGEGGGGRAGGGGLKLVL